MFTKGDKCKTCQPGYYLKENKCLLCDELNENNCDANSCYSKEEKKCYSCKSGYFLDSITNLCEKVH